MIRRAFPNTASSGLALNGSFALVAVAVASLAGAIATPVLVRQLGKYDYSVWVIVSQLGSYLLLLQPSFLTSITKLRASARNSQEEHQAEELVASALWFSLLLAGSGLVLLFGGWLTLGKLFPELSKSIVAARMSLVLVGVVVLLSFPFLVLAGMVAGGGEGYKNSFGFAVSKIGFVVAVVALAFADRVTLVTVSVAHLGCAMINYGVVFVAARGAISLKTRPAPLAKFRSSLGAELLTTGIWGWSAFLVTSLDIVLVGRFEFGATAAYSIAAGLVAIVLSVFSQVTLAVLPKLTIEQNLRKSTARISALLLPVSAVCCGALLLMGQVLARILVGQGLAMEMSIPLLLLTVAAFLRINVYAITTAAFASGHRRAVLGIAVAEAAVNTLASVAGGLAFGAKGVAGGTIVGIAFSAAVLYVVLGKKGAIATSKNYYAPLSFLAAIVLFLTTGGRPNRSTLRVVGFVLIFAPVLFATVISEIKRFPVDRHSRKLV
jgi:O-antigen/teichoic acid export membrane protein